MTTQPDRQDGDGLQDCQPCHGTGRYMGRFGHNDPDCPNCRGSGKVPHEPTEMEIMTAELERQLKTPTRDAAEGAVPERETWWLAERIGQNQYAAEYGELPSLTPDPWRAARFKTEKEAFDFILRLATLRDEMQQTEHIFINKPHREHRFSFPPRDAALVATPQPVPDAMREALEWIEQDDRQWVSNPLPGLGEILDRSETGNVKVRGIYGRKALAALRSAPVPSPDRETVQMLLNLLNPLHGSLDKQTYDERLAQNFDAPRDAEHEVTITAQQERDLTQAVTILESRLRSPSATGAAEPDITDEMVECALKTYFVARHNTNAHENMRAALRAALYATSPVRGDREARRLLQNLEEACNKLAETRPQAAYDAMIAGGQKDLLWELDQARRAAITFLSLPVQPGAGETRQGVCTACGGHGVVRVPVVGGPFTNIAERESHDNEGEE